MKRIYPEFYYRKTVVSPEEYKNGFDKLYSQSPVLREGIFAYSPDLYRLLQKHNDKCDGKINQIKNDLLSRICFRTTPFGLLSGVGLGSFYEESVSDNNQMILVKHLTLDRNILGKIIEKIQLDARMMTEIAVYKNRNYIEEMEFYILKHHSHQ